MDKNFLSLKDFELSMREDALTRAELFKTTSIKWSSLTLKATGLCHMDVLVPRCL